MTRLENSNDEQKPAQVLSAHDRHLHNPQVRHWHAGCGTTSDYHHPMGMPAK